MVCGRRIGASLRSRRRRWSGARWWGGRLRLKVKEEAGASRLNALTDQEMQVLRLIARGASTKEVAGAIYRSEKRVEAIRTSIMKKLGCHDRVELTRYAIREGIVEP